MKLSTILAAGLVVAGALAPVAIATPAAAQHRVVVQERTVVRTAHRNYRPHKRTVCTTRYRHGHRVRDCRRVYR